MEPYREAVAALLAERPKLKSLEVLRRLRERGYGGGKSAVYELVRQLRQQAVRPICRFEGLRASSASTTSGKSGSSGPAVAGRECTSSPRGLKYSRYVLVSLVQNQRVETLVRTLAGTLPLRGLPLLAVFDRPGTIVTKSDPKTGAVLAWNATFADVAARLGVAVEVCWPARPNQKGSIENVVGWAKNSFFKQRQFVDLDDLQLQLQAWLEEVNERRVNRAPGGFPQSCCGRRSWAGCDRSSWRRSSWTCAMRCGSARPAW